MDIVVIAHFAGSPYHGMVYGQYYLAREWVRTGHNVTIIASSYSHTRMLQPADPAVLFAQEYIDGIRYIWVKTVAYSPENKFGRLKNITSFVTRIWWHKLPVERADLVISSSHYPLAIFPARKLARRHQARLVFEVRDIWPLTLVELGGASPHNPLILLMQSAEDYAYRVADKVVSVLPKAKEHMMHRGLRPDKYIYVPNGVAFDALGGEDLPERHAHALEKFKENNEFLVGYAGNINVANSLEELVMAISHFEKGQVGLVILGQGPLYGKLRNKCIRLGIKDRVLFLPAVRKNQVQAFLEQMDALFIGFHKCNRLYRFGVNPTKLSEYMAAARPVICALDGHIEAIEESGAGLVCEADNNIAIARAIEQLRNLPTSLREEMGCRGRRWVEKHRDYRLLAKRFLEEVMK